jgi:hypothetical protein
MPVSLAGLDPDAFLQQHVHDRREAVRGAGGIRDDVVRRGVVLALVHAHQQRLQLALAGRGDDDLLGAGRDVALRLLGVGEEARRLDDVVDLQLLPRQLARLLRGHDALHFVAADHQHVVVRRLRAALLRGERVLEAAVHRVVLHLVGEVVGVGGDVDDAHHVDLLAQQALVAERLEHEPSDAPEAVDSHSDCHRVTLP